MVEQKGALSWLLVFVFVAGVGFAAGHASHLIAPVHAASIAVPKSGTPAQRSRALWQTIRPRILADAKAELNNAEYIKRGEPIRAAWQELQYDTAEQSSDEVTRFHTKVWILLGDLYGAKGINPEYQNKARARLIKKIDSRLGELDKVAAALH